MQQDHLGAAPKWYPYNSSGVWEHLDTERIFLKKSSNIWCQDNDMDAKTMTTFIELFKKNYDFRELFSCNLLPFTFTL